MASGDRPRRVAMLEALRQLENDDDQNEEESAASESEDEIADIEELHDIQIDRDRSTEETVCQSSVGRGRGQGRGRGREVSQPVNDFVDKNGQAWHIDPPNQGRRRQADIIHQHAGPTPSARRAKTPAEIWSLFFPDDHLQKIVDYSQEKADILGINVHFTLSSLKALIGFMLYRGASQDSQIFLPDLFTDEAAPFYRTVMSRNNVQIWLKCLRFDSVADRAERKIKDPFTAFREVFDDWNSLLPKFFNASDCVTIDEQLVASRCRSPNRVYSPMKPGKFGEMIRWAADANFRYFFKGSPSTKRPSDPQSAALHKEANRSQALVEYLVAPFLRSGRNITGDRYFTSFPCAMKLLRDYKLTYLGTLMANKRDIAPVLHQRKAVFDSQFVFGGQEKQCTMVSYQATQTKNVLMLSTLHHNNSVSDEDHKKPIIIMEYNKTKCGVDVVDEMAKRYTTRSKILRWPVVHFQNLLDITSINTATLLSFLIPNWTDDRNRSGRRYMMLSLAKSLSRDYVQNRLNNSVGLHAGLQQLMKNFLGIVDVPLPVEARINEDPTRKRCDVCKNRGKAAREANKARGICNGCRKYVCKQHAVDVIVECNDCYDAHSQSDEN